MWVDRRHEHKTLLSYYGIRRDLAALVQRIEIRNFLGRQVRLSAELVPSLSPLVRPGDSYGADWEIRVDMRVPYGDIWWVFHRVERLNASVVENWDGLFLAKYVRDMVGRALHHELDEAFHFDGVRILRPACQGRLARIVVDRLAPMSDTVFGGNCGR